MKNNDMKRLLLSLLLLYSLPILASVNHTGYIFDDFEHKTDLFSIRSVLQTEDGTVWFGTDQSLYSFDGYDVSAHPCPDGPRLVHCLLPKEKGLLLGTNAGIYFFDAAKEQYHFLDFFGERTVYKMLQDEDFLYIGTDAGFYLADIRHQTVERVSHESVYSLARNGDDIYVGGENLLRRYSVRDRKLTVVLQGDIIPVAASIFPDGDDLWIGSHSSLIHYDLKVGRIIERPEMPVVKTICPIEYGRLIISTDYGIVQYDPASKETVPLNQAVAWASTADRSGDVWFATDNGLRLMHLHPATQMLSGLPDNQGARYGTILRDSRERLWLGSTQGIVLMDPSGKTVHFTMTSAGSKIPHNKIHKIVEDPYTSTILAATDGGCLRYDEQTQSFETLRIAGTHNWVYDLLPEQGGFWAASYEGVFRVDATGAVLARFDQTDGLTSNDIGCLGRDNLGDVWTLARDKKVARINPSTGTVTPFQHEGFSKVDCLISDQEGRIWLTSGPSILRVDRKQDTAEVAAITQGNTSDALAIVEVGGKIWVCLPNGIGIVDKDNLESRSISTFQSYNGGHYDPVRQMITLGRAGAVDQISLASLERVLTSRSKEPRITGILINDHKQIPTADMQSRKLELTYKENHLDISISDFDFNNELPHRFSYYLTGRWTLWSGTVTGNLISFTALRPGRYHLSILPENLIETPDYLLELTIRRPWFFSSAMQILYLLLIFGIIFIFVKILLMRRSLDMERTRREETVAQSRQKEAFFQDVAHEFKTPLSLVIGPLAKLIKETRDETQVQTLELIQENAMRISSLIHHSLDYYNETKGVTASLIKTETEFVEFARNIFDSYRENYPSLEFIFTSGREKIPVCLDIVKMETVMNNLLSNACKYTPEGGSVLMTLDADEDSEQVMIKVSDTGIGIPKDEIPFAFQRYFESSRTKQKGYDSTGIGLSVIKKYIDLHGGQVSVDSDDEGTSFTILLPGLTEPSTPAGHTENSSEEESDKPLIAIVDDNIQICAFIESLLRDRYRCVSSHNGRSGLKLCRDILPDLVISDVVMPIMDGLSMCRQLREYTPLSDIPIILLTAKDDRETEKRSIDLHIDIYITKPFDIENLTARVDQLLSGKKRMEQRLRVEMLSSPSTARALSQDELYLQNVTQLIEAHLDDSDLTVRRLCELGGYNEKRLYRRLKQLTGASVIEYIRSIRLKKAALLLQSCNYTVAEVMYSVGFNNASYFSRAFSAVYHMPPSEYMKSFRQDGK